MHVRGAHLDALFTPASVAVVGASPRPGYALTTIENLQALGYQGSIFPVNPRHPRVAGLRCYPSLEAVPGPLQTVVIAVPAAHVPEVVAAAADRGCEAAIVYSAGMGEGAGRGGAEWAEAVRETSRRTGLRVLGPNCLGTIDFAHGCALWPVVLPEGTPGGRGVALIAQSGNMPLTLASAGRGVRFSRLVSCGNQLDLTAAELMEHLLDAEDVSVVAVMLEGVPDLERFAAVLGRAADRDLPVVVLRAGRSRLGRVATLAHTGSLSGPDHLMHALLRRYGAVDARDLDELLAACAVLSADRRPRGRGIGALSTSGGECALLADLASEEGLQVPPLPPAAAERLRERLPAFISPANPLDVTAATWGDREVYRHAVEALASTPGVDVIVHLGDRPAHAPADDTAWGQILEGLAEGAARSAQPVVSISTVGDVREQHVQALADAGLVPLAGLRAGLAALGHAADRSRALAARRRPRPDPDQERRRQALGLLAGAGSVMAEAGAKELIRLYGIPAPPGRVVTSAAAAEEEARGLGFPVVLKLHGSGVTHKTELGGVILDVVDPAGVRSGFDTLQSRAARLALEDASVLVESQVEAGVELIVGGRNEPGFGPVLMVGAGGIFSELIDDVAHRLAPVDHEEALDMIAELRAASSLDGHRGRAPVDRDAVADCVVAAGRLLTELPEVRELDLNPLLCGRGCVAADALVVLAGGEEAGR